MQTIDILDELADQLDKTDKLILRMICAGYSQGEIAKEIGISRQAIGKRKKRIYRLVIERRRVCLTS